MGMQRDNELIRKLLIQFRDDFDPGDDGVSPESEKENYHIYLLLDAGFIKANVFNEMTGLSVYDNVKITTAGHDFLEAAENATIWKKAKASLKDKDMEITNVPLDVLTGYLKNQMKKYIGIE